MPASKDTVTHSSGNVFADLDLENADELLAKSELAHSIREILKSRQLTQTQAAKLLGTHQTHISRLNSGRGIDGMSFDLLMSWLTKLDRNVTLTVQKIPKNQQDGGSIQVSM